MADIEKIMSVSASDIEKIMGVEKDDIEKVMGVEIPSNAWYGDRGIAGGYNRYGRSSGTWYTNNIQYRSISGSSHCQKFGEFAAIGSDANVSVFKCSGVSGGGRGMFQGGDTSTNGGSSFPYANKHWYITIASTGDASTGTDMQSYTPAGGSLITGHAFDSQAGSSDGTTGIIAASGFGQTFYNTMSSTGAAALGGTLITQWSSFGGGGGGTYAFFVGYKTGGTDAIEYMAFATPGNNASGWGDLARTGQFHKTCSSDTRSITWGFYGNTDLSGEGSAPVTDAMEYWSHASTGNASTFGNTTGIYCSTNDTTFGKYSGFALSNGTRGERWTGWTITGDNQPNGSDCNYIGDMNVDFVTIASTGNAADSGYNFADLDSTGMSYTDHYGAGISG